MGRKPALVPISKSGEVPPRDWTKIRAPSSFFAISFSWLSAPLRARIQDTVNIHSLASAVRDGGDDALCDRHRRGDRIGQKLPYCVGIEGNMSMFAERARRAIGDAEQIGAARPRGFCYFDRV